MNYPEEIFPYFFDSSFVVFLEKSILGLPNWKWLLLVFGIVILFFSRNIFLWFITKIKKAQNYFGEKTFLNFFLDQPIEKGLSWVIVSLFALIALDFLQMPPVVDKYGTIIIKLFLSVNVIRICYLAAEALGLSIEEWSKTTESTLDNQLAPFANKVLKVIVVTVGGLVILQNFGVNVTALLAGLGIGGVALAFAAQDTVANVFGTVTILLDSPFKIGDWVKIGDTEGTVEDVGFRSTRIRTLYNSLITIPNSVVAKEKVDNMAMREWIRFRHIVGFTYDANPQMLEKFCETLKYYLLQDSSVDRSRIIVNFQSYGDWSMNILINFHYKLEPEQTEAAKNNEFLNLIYTISVQEKLSFAFPTRTILEK